MPISGEQLRAARAMAGVTQRELAQMADVSQPTLARLELQKGAIQAHYGTIIRLMAALEQVGVVFTRRGVEKREG